MVRKSLISIVLQSLINVAVENKVGGDEGNGNETNWLNSSVSKKSTGADYLTSK